MSEGAAARERVEGDPVALASVLALVSGAVALGYPAFTGLAGTLAALALGAFLIGYRRRHPGRLPVERQAVIGVGLFSTAAGSALFLLPTEFEFVRPLLLGAATTPLWWATRSSVAVSGGPRA